MEDSLKQMLNVQNSTVNWTEILTALLVFITAVYVYFTFRMMKASEKSVNATRESIEIMKKQIEASLRPYIDFELRRYPNNIIYMHIRNSGKINAENLSLSINKDFQPLGSYGGKDNLKESVLFKNGVASLTPGTEVTVGMLEIGEIGKLENISPSKFKITAKYTWTGRKEPIIEETEIDMTAFMGSGMIPKPDLLYEVSDIKKILKSLEQKIK